MRPTVVICLAALAAVLPPAHTQQRSWLPIEPGLTWTYRGHVRWTGSDQRVHGDSIKWTMKIVAVRTGPNARAALVRGWVLSLAWHEPSKKPAYSALIERGGQLFHVAAQDSASAAALLESAVRTGAPPPASSDLVLDSTLAVGRVYGRDSVTSKRDDSIYGWRVASERAISAPASWNAGAARVQRMTLEYRSLPDHQSIDVVRGVGITRFVYSHHGTVADTDVRLVSVTRTVARD